jgi:hypothetical protein
VVAFDRNGWSPSTGIYIEVRVPFGKLAFVPREDGRHGRVSIHSPEYQGMLALLRQARLDTGLTQVEVASASG